MCQEEHTTTNMKPNLDKLIGFDAKNKDDYSTYICFFCNLILRNPCQLNCGHRYCQFCIENQQPIAKCKICDEETSVDEVIIDKGCRNDMKNLKISCFLCEWTGLFKNYEQHLNEIHSEVKCEFCGETFESTNNLIQHGVLCEKTSLNCELEPYGCSEKFQRIHRQNHVLSYTHQHILVQLLTQNISSSTMTMNQKDEKNGSSENLSKEEILSSIENLTENVGLLTDETQRTNTEFLQQQKRIDGLSENVSKMNETAQETKVYLEAQRMNQVTFEHELQSLQECVHNLKNTSYDGSLLWKIDDIQRKMTAAQNGQQTSIYSPVFYSSIYGYKMRVRLYLAGDGSGRQTHISIFFVLMRGDYDTILEFPFKYKIVFCLLDQTSQRKHIIDSFRPDTKSSSFQRPSSDMNTASGIPKFVPLPLIQQDNSPYIQNDSMLIRVMVDFNDMPKNILFYSLQLNPGLPTNVQHNSIKRESEKTDNK